VDSKTEGLKCLLFSPDLPDEKAFLRDVELSKSDRWAANALVQRLGTAMLARAADPGSDQAHNDVARQVPNIELLTRTQYASLSILPCERLPKGSAAVVPEYPPTARDRPWLQACESLHVPVSLVLPYLQYTEAHRPVPSPAAPAFLRPFYPLAATPDPETQEALRMGRYYLNHVHKSSSWVLPVHSGADPSAAAFLRRALRVENHPLDPLEGVGIVIEEGADGMCRIVSLQDSGPAQKTGLVLLDDRLVSIDGVSVHSPADAEIVEPSR
ncbi:hypothetical protein T484DRAFT_1774346, partial [Baffinella frigidus]